MEPPRRPKFTAAEVAVLRQVWRRTMADEQDALRAYREVADERRRASLLEGWHLAMDRLLRAQDQYLRARLSFARRLEVDEPEVDDWPKEAWPPEYG